MQKVAEIKVKSYGSVNTMPDGIQIDLTIVVRANDYPKTFGELNARVSAVNASLSRAKTSTAATTKSYDIEEVWTDEFNAEKRKFHGYKATQKMGVIIPLDQALLGRVIGELANSDSKPRIGFRFLIRDAEKMKRAARISAVVKAKEAATDLAETAGLKLVAVKSIDFAATSQRLRDELQFEMGDAAQFCITEVPDVEPDAIIFEEMVNMVWEAAPL